MLGQRKMLKADINHISRLIDLYLYKKDFIAEKSSQKKSDETLKHLETVLKKTQRDHDALPTGHMYTGIFYIRKIHYNNTVESVKMSGTAFLREDIISWKINSDHEYAQDIYYIRDIYKDESFKEAIKREDCEPVFEKDYKY